MDAPRIAATAVEEDTLVTARLNALIRLSLEKNYDIHIVSCLPDRSEGVILIYKETLMGMQGDPAETLAQNLPRIPR